MQAELPRLRERLGGPPAAARILVIRLGALGDVVRTRFAFAALRRLYPEARIDWLVEDRAAAGLEGIAGLDEVVRVTRRNLRPSRPGAFLRGVSGVVRELRQRRYDLAIDFHGILKSAFFARASEIPMRLGYARGHARDGSHLLLTHRVSFDPSAVSRFARNDALVRYLGGEPVSEPPPLDLPPGGAPELAGLPPRLITLHPGTSPATRYKRWPPERYARVARRLKERAGIDSLVTWGPVEGEREIAEAVVAEAGGAAHLAPETSSISHVLSLMSGTRLFLGSDSGPMHLASLVGLPVVALFGPTHPVENAPFPGLPQRILCHDVGCNPCRLGCPPLTCMAAIGIEEVVKAGLELLQPA